MPKDTLEHSQDMRKTRKKQSAGTMAKVILNPFIQDIRGKLGGYVFRHTPAGEMTIIKRADMSGVKWSKAQKANRQRFKEAVAYAQAALADPQIRKVYEKAAAKQGKRPYDLAKSDYLKGKNLLTTEDR